MQAQKSLPRSRTFGSGKQDQLTTGKSKKTTYENCLNCCGNFWGTCRAWVPCCCCCPYPYQQISQGYVGLLQEFGRFEKQLPPGMHFVNQCSGQITMVDMKTHSGQVNRSVILTKDNITSEIDTVLYYRIVDPIKCIYRLNNLAGAMLEVTQSVMRTVCGEHTLQELLVDRIQISHEIEEYVEAIVNEWGVYVEKLFIKDQRLSEDMRQALALAGTTKKMTEAKIISAQADVDAAKFQRETSDILSSQAAMQIRMLETLQQIARGASKKVVMMGL
ncbi:unnamed protein product [Paramecium pentaurelia]|uniref:Band 7 domain-containing protein n=1 Tax=Paramecium pentaurelia TaxID=43138 RepID=A0A8S1UXT1_9CILI|nr:unnamed protein product [Paramecium pentaurelia]